MNRMGRFWAIVVKEFIEIRRDPRTLGLIVLMPILLLILFGFAITLDIREIPMAVCDRDKSAESRRLIESFSSSRHFKSVDPEACGKESILLARATARVYLEIPAGFGRQILSGTGASVQVLVDGADNNTATVSVGYAERILRSFLPTGSYIPAAVTSRRVEVEHRIWFNSELKSAYFITPGIIGMLIMIIGVALPAMAIVKERELGTAEVLLSSPVRPLEVILGKMLPYGIISFGVIVLTLMAGVVVFHVPFLGSALHLFYQILIFLLAALGMGLLISTIARTRPVAYFISLLTTLLPTFILSGFIFPVESMPLPLQGVSFLIPTTHFLIILRAILLKGVGASAVWPHTLYLLGFALVMITISIKRFQTRMA